MLRRMVRETSLSVDNLVMPFFVRPGKAVRRPIPSMPGQHQLSVDELVKEARAARDSGIPAIILFGIPDEKDRRASGAYRRDGIVQRAVRELKSSVEGLLLITDVCLCEYMEHGHCGVVKTGPQSTVHRPLKNYKGHGPSSMDRRLIDNDATLVLLAKTALSHAEAGADMVAPSAMMDGQVRAIRSALDEGGRTDTPIMSYSAKYASSLYAPFRDAAESPPRFGDRGSYQMDSANADEALREVALDVEEGADIVMVKPALAYLDIVRRVRERFNVPVAAYNVSGEYAMVKAAARAGWIDEKRAVLEILTGIRRAGASIIISYHARDVARYL